MFRGIPGFYSTSGAVDYTAVIFCAHLVAVKCKVSLLLVPGKYSYALGQLPADVFPPYFRQISHASPLRMRENLSERGL